MRHAISILAGLCAGAALLGAGPAWAGDPMVNTYANTVVTTAEPGGATTDMLFNKDDTYTADTTGPDGKPLHYSGHWSLKDAGKTICLTAQVPEGAKAPPASCSPLEEHAVGDSWTVTNDQKQSFKVSIKAGR